MSLKDPSDMSAPDSSPKPIEATPDSLARILAERPVLWVGAGASIAAGYPSTGRLVDAMIQAADDPIDPDLSFSPGWPGQMCSFDNSGRSTPTPDSWRRCSKRGSVLT
jgi:hypothetical protein